MICALCKKEIKTDRYFSRKSVCPKCGGDLHICLNCRFFSESSHNKCLEPKAEFQRTRDRANFCDFFVFSQNPASSSSDNEKETARKKLDDLFRKWAVISHRGEAGWPHSDVVESRLHGFWWTHYSVSARRGLKTRWKFCKISKGSVISLFIA